MDAPLGARPELSLALRIVGLLMTGLMIAAVAAMFFSTHLPSPPAIRAAQVVGAPVGLWAAWEGRPGGAFDPARTGRDSGLLKSAVVRAPLMGLFMFLIAFTAVEDGVLALATAAIGQPASRTLTVRGVAHANKGCDHFKVREVRWLLDRALCGASEDLARARPGDQLVVFGRASAFGLNVERYELRSATSPRGDTPAQMP